MLKLSQSDYLSLRQHGEETYPHECCGVLLGRFDNNGAESVSESVSKTVSRIARCGNTRADSPHNRYQIDPRELIRIQREGRERAEDVGRVCHSPTRPPA